MNIVLTINEKYAKIAVVLMTSIFENNKNSSFLIHIFTDGLTAKSKTKLNLCAKRFNQRIKIYQINDQVFTGFSDSFSLIAYYRLLIPKLLAPSIDKVLYLDVDTIVTNRLDSLFSINLENNSLAAVPDYVEKQNPSWKRLNKSKDFIYFNSGVLLLNLQYWRKHNLTEKILNLLKKESTNFRYPDQDALNEICANTKIILPYQYNVINPFLSDKNFIELNKESIIKAYKNPTIIHYAGMKPWILEEDKHVFSCLWHKYNKMSAKIKTQFHHKGIRKIKFLILYYFHIAKERKIQNKQIIEYILNL